MEEYDVLVVGGGASGLLAAGTAATCGARTALLEKNEKPGRKLYITGKGRCNVTNDADISEFIPHTPTNGRFLYSAFSAFSNRDLIALLARFGVQTKVERGDRVFPTSDKSSDVISALTRYLREGGARRIFARRVILATGGASYPQTGSTGDGYAMASEVGHTVVAPRPSLVPLVTRESWVAELMGLSLRNVAIRVTDETGRERYRDFGEMLFCHFGVSGPIILSASAYLRDFSHPYRLEIDLKPALDEQTLDKRILRDFSESANRDFANSLSALLPKKLVPVVVRLSGIAPTKKVHDITREERKKLVSLIKAFPLTLCGARPLAEAIITSGGVSTREIDPKTMASRKVSGLYFAGELIDVDAVTGGYNLQIAFSTGYLAGESAALSALSD